MSNRPKLKILEHDVEQPDPASLSMENAVKSPKRPKKRLKLWEVEPWLLCSIVGTCLTPPDLDRVMKRHRLEFDDDIREHQLHSYFVEQASKDAPVGRSLNKRLDDKFTRAIRLVSQESDEIELLALWEEFCSKGQVAAGYWAFLSHTHVPQRLRHNIFGDIHMLSHFMGGYNRQNAKALWQAERRNEQLAGKLTKARTRAHETTAAKDQKIGELNSELEETRHQLTTAYMRITTGRIRPIDRPSNDLRRHERRLSATRARIRSLEQETERLRNLLDAMTDLETPLPRPAPLPGINQRQNEPVPVSLDGRQLLYVGGRCHILPHLRARAEACAACLLHHDGGREETLKSLDGLIEQADVVFCPIDCISHQACLKAKHLCKQQAKPFIPLRSSSATCFAKTIATLKLANDAGNSYSKA